MLTLLGWLKDFLLALPSLYWQRKMKRKLRDLADRLEAFQAERRAVAPITTAEMSVPECARVHVEWNDETRRLFKQRFLPELRDLQEELDSRETSNAMLFDRFDLSQVRIDRIVNRLRKLARRKRLRR